MQFRELTPEEKLEFRQWARNNYEPMSDVNPLWHPVVRGECAIINAEWIEAKEAEGYDVDEAQEWTDYDPDC